jgi:hypothetical protein
MLQTSSDQRENIAMRAIQIPLTINNATTGHKLQGSGVDNLFVHNWSRVQNWVYVILSRVKTRSGLFCRKPLPRNNLNQYRVPPALSRMLDRFRQRSPTQWTDADYQRLFPEDA